MHEDHERQYPHARSTEAILRRQRRHRFNKLVQILDYLIESVGNFSLLLVYFLGSQNETMSYVGQFICMMFFSIFIPLGYLINEHRVKMIILAQGWTEGFKAIFYSPERIRRLDREEIINALLRPGQSNTTNPDAFTQNTQIRPSLGKTDKTTHAKAGNANPIEKSHGTISSRRNIATCRCLNTSRSVRHSEEEERLAIEDVEENPKCIRQPASKNSTVKKDGKGTKQLVYVVAHNRYPSNDRKLQNRTIPHCWSANENSRENAKKMEKRRKKSKRIEQA